METLLQWLQDVVNHSAVGNNLTTSITEYNSTIWAYSEVVAKQVVKPISLAILAFFLLLEFANLYKKIDASGGSFNIQMILPIFIKIGLAKILMDNFDVIILAIQGIGITIVERIQDVLPHMQKSGAFNIQPLKDAVDDLGFVEQIWAGIIILISLLFAKIATIIANFAIVMRFFEMYLLTAIAPLPISALPSEEYGQITKNFFKIFASIALSTVILYLVLAFYAVLGTSLIHTNSGSFLDVSFSIFGYNVLLIFIVVKTYSLSKSIMGVMG